MQLKNIQSHYQQQNMIQGNHSLERCQCCGCLDGETFQHPLPEMWGLWRSPIRIEQLTPPPPRKKANTCIYKYDIICINGTMVVHNPEKNFP